MTYIVCVLLVGAGSAKCTEANGDLLRRYQAECSAKAHDPIGKCTALVASDGKRWFFVHDTL